MKSEFKQRLIPPILLGVIITAVLFLIYPKEDWLMIASLFIGCGIAVGLFIANIKKI